MVYLKLECVGPRDALEYVYYLTKAKRRSYELARIERPQGARREHPLQKNEREARGPAPGDVLVVAEQGCLQVFPHVPDVVCIGRTRNSAIPSINPLQMYRPIDQMTRYGSLPTAQLSSWCCFRQSRTGTRSIERRSRVIRWTFRLSPYFGLLYPANLPYRASTVPTVPSTSFSHHPAK